MRLYKLVAVAALLPFYAACGGGGSADSPVTPTPNPTPTPPAANAVTLGVQSFTPTTLTVPAGTTVTWNWNSCSDSGGYSGTSTCVTHDVTFDDGSNITSGAQSSGTFTRQFMVAGTFNYHCSIHGAALMSGMVVVQ
jgi:plastocyanin